MRATTHEVDTDTGAVIMPDRTSAEAAVAVAYAATGPYSYAIRRDANGTLSQALREDGVALARHLQEAAEREGRRGDNWAPDLFEALSMASESAKTAEHPLDFARYLLLMRAHGALEALRHLGSGVATLACNNDDHDAKALWDLMRGEVTQRRDAHIPTGWPTRPRV